jgi:hypothetical protein
VGEFEALQLISRLWSWEMSENNNSSSGAQNGKRVKSPALENNLNASVNTILTIGVCIWDSSDSIIPVDVEECTTAGDICHYVGFSLSLTEDDCEYHRLMLVCTLTNETTQANCHHLRTLDNDERIYDIAKTVGTKQVKKSNYTFKDVAWYFKDVRSNPICFNNEEISGSSSEDEDAVFVSKDDLSYIMEAERRGYLYKRSSKDPNLWKRRFCALTDKFWCINTKRRDFKATCIPLYDDVLVQDSTPSFNFPHVIVVNCPWKVKYFRANNREEQQGWVEDLNERAQLSRENDVIHIAEMICCDEESNANDRIVKVMRPLFESDAVLISLLALDVNCCGSRYIKDYYFKAGFDMDSDSDEDLDIPVVKKDNKPAPASSKQSVSVAAAPVHAVPPALPSAASMEAMFQNQLQALLNQQKMEYEKSMAEQMKKFEMVMQSQNQQSTQLHAATALPTPARETKTVQQPAAKQSTAKKPAKSPANGSKNSAQAGDEDDDTEFLFNAVNSALNHTQQTPSPVKGLSMVQQQLNKSQQEQQLQKAKNTHSFPPPGFPALAASTGEKSAQSTPVQDKKRRSLTVSATKTGNADAAPLAPMIAFPTETSVVPVAAGLPSRFSGEVSHLLSKKKFVWAELVQLTQANNRFSGDFNFDSLIDAAWVTTRPPADCKGKKVHDIIAIDCEMCQSEDPLTGNKDHGALVRVSVVSGTNYDEVCLYLKHL